MNFIHFFKNVTTSKKKNNKPEWKKSEDFCCICCDTMTESDKFLCGHEFCTECIEALIYYNGLKATCPLCRLPIYASADTKKGNQSIKINQKKWITGSLIIICFIVLPSVCYFRNFVQCNNI